MVSRTTQAVGVATQVPGEGAFFLAMTRERGSDPEYGVGGFRGHVVRVILETNR